MSLFMSAVLLISFSGCNSMSKTLQGGLIGGGGGAAVGAIQGASVQTVTDNNGYTGIQVTFEDGILFDTGKYALKTKARQALTRFAASLVNDPNTNVQIFGHTDNTGSRATNEKLSLNRANAVKSYLVDSGVASYRMETKGLAYDYPVASNDTAEGRAQNRRVEVYITADETMIQQAEAGNLQ